MKSYFVEIKMVERCEWNFKENFIRRRRKMTQFNENHERMSNRSYLEHLENFIIQPKSIH